MSSFEFFKRFAAVCSPLVQLSRNGIRMWRPVNLRARQRVRRGAVAVGSERLEQRTLLAGNVTAAVVSGDLIVQGDDADNVVDLFTSENGNIVLRGLDGTSINGETEFVPDDGIPEISGDLQILLADGDDTLTINGIQIADSLQIEDDAGDNTLMIQSCATGANYWIQYGAGDDVITVSDSTAGRHFFLNPSGGENVLLTERIQVSGDTLFQGGDQTDSLIFSASNFSDDLLVSSGAGSDFLFVGPSEEGETSTVIDNDVQMRTGDGDDDVVFRGPNVFGGITILTSAAGTNRTQIESGNEFASEPQRSGFSSDSIPSTETDQVVSAVLTRVSDVQPPQILPPPLSLDLSANATTPSSNTLVTRNADFVIAGTTAAGAVITIDSDGDGEFDDGTTGTDEAGQFSSIVTLTNTSENKGVNTIQVKSSLDGAETIESLDVHLAEGTVLRFASSLGTFDVELLDEDAPQTVTAFLADLSRNDNSIIHRSVDNFVIQGGGFSVSDHDTTPPVVSRITPFSAPPNEFALADNSNVRGTLSTAQVGGNINSFTGQYFLNTVDNLFLDAIPHTVFGNVIGSGMDVVDAINRLPEFNLVSDFGQTALTDVPLQNYADTSVPAGHDNFVIFESISVLLPDAVADDGSDELDVDEDQI
ncbi:MAG: peptidylprolyl isomerase [Fuerstiella sp.]|nr:peptidylprolyl isomerase [Fuerstiella sp.]